MTKNVLFYARYSTDRQNEVSIETQIELCEAFVTGTGASPYTFAVDNEVISDSVFKYHDTLTSRAEIGDLTAASGSASALA